MRSKIEASWVIGHERGEHRLIRDGVVVYEDDKIVFVGQDFDGDVDTVIDARGKQFDPRIVDEFVAMIKEREPVQVDDPHILPSEGQ